MFAPVRPTLVLCGILGERFPVYDLCCYEATLELCTAVLLAVWCSSSVLRTATSEDPSVWLPLAGPVVTSVLRTGTSVLAPRLGARLRVPAGRWQPLVAALLLASSCYMVLGQVGVLIVWVSASEDARASEGSPGWAETLFKLLAPIINVGSSCLWFVCVPLPPAPEGKGAPKPQALPVTSFVVCDVDAECKNSACVICLEELSSGSLAGRLPCDHVFHDGCVRGWLANGHSQARCPMRCSSDASSDRGLGSRGDEQPAPGPAVPELRGVARASSRLEIV